MVARSISTFRISRGIGQYHSSDHFAVLGLPVTADAKQVRQRYLTIVRRLHPDVYGMSPEEKEVACEYLAKMVSPAYNILMNERERAEYSCLIRLIAKRLVKQEHSLQPVSAIANKLLAAPKDFSYERAVEVVAEQQYASLQKIMSYTVQLSELNLVYLVATEGYVGSTTQDKIKNKSEVPISTASPKTTENPETNSKSAQTGSSASRVNKSGSVDDLIKKIEELITQKQWAAALHELREVLKQDNTNAKVHALLGVVYFNQKLGGMAKVSFQQALKYNPKEAIALMYLSKIESGDSATPKGKPDNSTKDKGKGFFGWLGGS